MIQVVKYYKTFFFISGILVLASIAALSIYGLNLGIDFVGGSFLEVKFDSTPDTQKISSDLAAAGYGNAVVQPGSDNHVIIKTQNVHSTVEREKLSGLLKSNFGNFEEIKFDSIGPIVGAELRQKAFWQVGAVILGILFYIAYAFRKVGKTDRRVSSWKLSWAAIIALAHDLIIVLGVFAVLGKFYHVEVDALFITALLTVLGFSVHDTIVVFDRLRENMQKGLGLNFAQTLNYSVNQTLTRSVNTSVTVLLVLLSMALFGGSTIHYFVIALLVGITVGTYSSIYVASALMLVWNKE